MDRKRHDQRGPEQPPSARMRVKVVLHGAVQGVGFRPFVHRLATEMSLSGWVNNSPQGVFLEAEGERLILENFLERLQSERPALSVIQTMETTWLDTAGFNGFEIRASKHSGGKSALVLPDIATCPNCLNEIFSPTNRRFRYPFTNCTHCGPRFSIIEDLPYDRANTAMKEFEMCPLCRKEYTDPRDRRFHAQPNACPVCGPHLEFWGADGRMLYGKLEALRAAADAICDGQIVAVKGVGGFHLVADARNEKVIQLLRERKHREEKPFALMFPSLEMLVGVCRVSALEQRLLLSPESPIVLLEKRGDEKQAISKTVAPGNPNLGAMLPSNPIHHLLMAELDFPVVATSGNLSDEPICTDETEALDRLRGMADYFLVHNRRIVRHVDDSIVRIVLGREMVLRRARGYAPLPIHLRTAKCPTRPKGDGDVLATAGYSRAKTILAVGAHLKNSVALAMDENVYVSQHIGDLETAEAESAFRRVVADFHKLYDTKTDVVATDSHPGYISTRFAEESGLRMERVQHHEAHIWSCLAENEIELPLLGVAWDGTGYGTDGTVWGGEFFEFTTDGVERVASLRPFRLPGSNAAVKEPRRSALGLMFEMYGDSIFEKRELSPVAAFTDVELGLLKTMLNRDLNSPKTSSVGRLFDAIASVTGLRQQMRFEGQAAMELEFALGTSDANGAYELPLLTKHGLCILDWAPMVEEIIKDRRAGISLGTVSVKFHNGLANAIAAVAGRFGHQRVALSGGCFQNRYLLERSVSMLRAKGFQAYWHQRIPTNDGGIALGQVMAARQANEKLNLISNRS